jgi:hypothetical protein
VIRSIHVDRAKARGGEHGAYPVVMDPVPSFRHVTNVLDIAAWLIPSLIQRSFPAGWDRDQREVVLLDVADGPIFDAHTAPPGFGSHFRKWPRKHRKSAW